MIRGFDFILTVPTTMDQTIMFISTDFFCIFSVFTLWSTDTWTSPIWQFLYVLFTAIKCDILARISLLLLLFDFSTSALVDGFSMEFEWL